MAEAAGGTDKVELKKLLTLSKKQPVNCGIGMTKDGAIMHLDRMKQPKVLVKELEKNHKDIKNPLWGTAFVDMDEDPKLVILTLNKAASGIANKLKKTLKGTGFSKVEIRLEDGTAVEKADEEEEAQATAARPTAPATNGAPPPAASDTGRSVAAETVRPASPNAAPPTASINLDAPERPVAAAQAPPVTPAAPDMDALTRQLTDLVKRMIPALAADPSRAATLKGLAVSAQASLKSGDAGAAETSIASLQTVLTQSGATNGAALAADAAPATPAAPTAPTPSPAIAKARQAWMATRQKVEGDIGKLHGAFAGAFKGHGKEADFTRAFRTRVDTVLGTLDEALAHKLDAVNSATDPAQRTKLVQEAHATIQSYVSHVSSDPTIAALDTNPFAPIAIQKTMITTLSALSKAIT